MRTGAPWADMPRRYPPYSTCFGRFRQWCRTGTLRNVVTALRRCLGGAVNDIESFIDGSYIPAKSGGSCVGKSRGGNTTKVMALVDGEGLPLAVSMADGSRHDVVLVDQTLDDAFVEELPPKLIGDKAFDSSKLQQQLADQRNIELVAPKRGGQRPSKRRQDGRAFRRYKRRWKVENLFAWLKRFRRIATRWEHEAEHYLGFLYLGCAIILLRTGW